MKCNLIGIENARSKMLKNEGIEVGKNGEGDREICSYLQCGVGLDTISPLQNRLHLSAWQIVR